MRGSGGGARDHPLCSFAACVPPKDWSAEDVRYVGLREHARDGCDGVDVVTLAHKDILARVGVFVVIFASYASANTDGE